MSVDLDPKLAEQIEEKVRAGEFASVQDAVNGLLLLVVGAEEQPSDDDLEHLRKEIEIGVAQADRGELTEWDGDEIWADVERRYAEESKTKGS